MAAVLGQPEICYRNCMVGTFADVAQIMASGILSHKMPLSRANHSGLAVLIIIEIAWLGPLRKLPMPLSRSERF